jgi:hypothetical protein
MSLRAFGQQHNKIVSHDEKTPHAMGFLSGLLPRKRDLEIFTKNLCLKNGAFRQHYNVLLQV